MVMANEMGQKVRQSEATMYYDERRDLILETEASF